MRAVEQIDNSADYAVMASSIRACKFPFVRTILSASILMTLVVAAGCQRNTQADKQAPPAVWFDVLDEPIRVSAEDAKALLDRAADRLANRDVRDAFPETLTADRGKRMVFLTVTDGVEPASVFVGAGTGLIVAIDDAAKRARRAWGERKVAWIQGDFIRGVRPPEGKWEGAPLGLRPDEGIAFARQVGVAFTPEQLPRHKVLTPEGRYVAGSVKQAQIGSEPELPKFLFQTDAYYLDQGRLMAVRRDDWLDPRMPVTRLELVESVSLAARYLTNTVRDDGTFRYQYNPADGTTDDDYNIVRHAGSITALLEAYEFCGKDDARMLDSARRALDHLRSAIQPAEGIENAAVVVHQNRVTLGGNGLTILGMARYTALSGDTRYLEDARRLARWIAATQNRAGKFTIHEQHYDSSTIVSSSKPYFPGEAMYALCLLHDIDPSGPWLDVADRGLRYMIFTADPEIDSKLVFQDHWLLYALNHVHQRRPDARLLDHAKKMVRTTMATQLLADVPRRAWTGAYIIPPNANNTATRVEGLCAGYFMFERAGLKEELPPIRKSVSEALRFQLRQQYLIPGSMHYPHAARLAGGFQNATDDPRVRIDTVQHNIAAMIGASGVISE